MEKTQLFVVIARQVYNELPSFIRNSIFLMDTNGFEVTLGPMEWGTKCQLEQIANEMHHPESTGMYTCQLRC
jgi:hypothetical protein